MNVSRARGDEGLRTAYSAPNELREVSCVVSASSVCQWPLPA
jgi:hypothetical protein